MVPQILFPLNSHMKSRQYAPLWERIKFEQQLILAVTLKSLKSMPNLEVSSLLPFVVNENSVHLYTQGS